MHRLQLGKWRWIELVASAFNLAGIYLGTTTFEGALIYLGALVFWYWLCIGQKMWGLMPLNIACTFVTCLNLWRHMPPGFTF